MWTCAGAAEQYGAALREDPCDSVAANNRALAAMFGGDLAGGIASLEAAFLEAPGQLMQAGGGGCCAGHAQQAALVWAPST